MARRVVALAGAVIALAVALVAGSVELSGRVGAAPCAADAVGLDNLEALFSRSHLCYNGTQQACPCSSEDRAAVS
jgi:hypothetical protein